MLVDPKTYANDTDSSFDESKINTFTVRRCMGNGFNGNLSFDEKYISDFDPEILSLDSAEEILHDVGFFPSEETIPWELLCVVAYVYPETSPFDSGIFITTRTVEKNMIVGLPGSSTEVILQRPFVGFTLDKKGHPEYRLCLGNLVSKGYRKDMGKLTESESRIGDLLFGYFYPVKKEAKE